MLLKHHMFIVDVDVDVDVNGGDGDDGRDRDLWRRHIYSCHQHSRGKRLGREEAARKGFSKSLCIRNIILHCWIGSPSQHRPHTGKRQTTLPLTFVNLQDGAQRHSLHCYPLPLRHSTWQQFQSAKSH